MVLGNEERNLRKHMDSLKKLKMLRFELWQFSKSEIKNEAMIKGKSRQNPSSVF